MAAALRQSWVAFAALLVGVAACGGGDSVPDRTTFGGERATELLVPSSYDHAVPAPIVLVLHGYSINGAVEAGYTRLADLTREGVLVVAPDGTEDPDGNLYWNAEHQGCGLGGDTRPDDVGYLLGLLDEIAAVFNVDPDRVYVFGHSNGGFMAYRLACEHADRVAALISLAGAPALDPDDCAPSSPLSILQIHGDADDTVLYGGADAVVDIPCPYPAATDTVARFAAFNGCDAQLSASGERLDLESSLPGTDTRIDTHANCAAGIATELWTIEGGGHIPALRPDAYLTMWDFFRAHPRP
ncbi:MAG TPA: alpha/beta fold hydrolase [Kofleriaceae bacterium]|nr:alpha/beta fold hydrolase [Kofleriaceae bacterium]